MIGTLLLPLLILFIICEIPIAISMGLAGMVYFLVNGIPLGTFLQQALSGADSFVLMAIPLFMFAGELMNEGGELHSISSPVGYTDHSPDWFSPHHVSPHMYDFYIYLNGLSEAGE